jgi:AcrR family transcriptional regulator
MVDRDVTEGTLSDRDAVRGVSAGLAETAGLLADPDGMGAALAGPDVTEGPRSDADGVGGVLADLAETGRLLADPDGTEGVLAGQADDLDAANGLGDLDDLWPPFGPRAHRDGDVPRQHRGRRGSALSRAEIVSAAIAVADAEGGDAINMRRIALELGVGTMSLYWHVADKSHLLDLMLDAIEGEAMVIEVTGDVRRDLAHIGRQEHALLLSHRWAMEFIGGRPPLGPHTLLNLERALAILDGVGVDTRTAIDMLMTLYTYVTGAVLRELREMRAQRDQENSGLDPAESDAGIAEWMARLERPGRFTRFLSIFEQDIDPDSPETREERFEFGLDCVLDGIVARIGPTSRIY